MSKISIEVIEESAIMGEQFKKISSREAFPAARQFSQANDPFRTAAGCHEPFFGFVICPSQI